MLLDVYSCGGNGPSSGLYFRRRLGVACIVILLVVSGVITGLSDSLSSGTNSQVAFRIEKDVEFLGPDRKEKADLYLPSSKGSELHPAVLIIHGGGWTGGDKGKTREINIGTNLALNGYVAMSINYVLATDEKATWPQNLFDCKSAILWLRKNAERLHIDASRIGVIGGSAGGHLAALVALTDKKDGFEPPGTGAEISSRVQCAVILYGPSDLLDYRDVKMLGKTRAEAPELYRRASSTTYADSNDPPCLILHGTADKTVSPSQSKALAAALKKAGVPHELVIVDGAPHTFHLQPKQRDLRPLVLGFLDTHLKAARTPSVR